MSATLDVQAAANAALRALGAGDWARARTELEKVVAAGKAGADVFAALGVACHRQGDAAAADAAADRALTLQPRNLRAALLKADLLNARGALHEANVYYRAVVDIAESAPSMSPDLVEGVKRARTWRDRLRSEMEEALRADLAKAGYVEGRSHPRFQHALDVATGRRQVYLQQPRNFFYPELPNIQFYDRAMFPWMDAVEAATEEITAEMLALLGEEASHFQPYLRTNPNAPNQPDYPLIDSMDWSTSHLWKDGRETPSAARCPRTMAALGEAPLCRVSTRSPNILFSQLKAGAHILPHTGAVNTRLICHLPLVVPPDCQFRVGNEVRLWEKGKAWVFDDTIEHEARNGSDRTRVVLLFDIWRPELSEEERALVSACLEALDRYSEGSPAWE